MEFWGYPLLIKKAPYPKQHPGTLRPIHGSPVKSLSILETPQTLWSQLCLKKTTKILNPGFVWVCWGICVCHSDPCWGRLLLTSLVGWTKHIFVGHLSFSVGQNLPILLRCNSSLSGFVSQDAPKSCGQSSVSTWPCSWWFIGDVISKHIYHGFAHHWHPNLHGFSETSPHSSPRGPAPALDGATGPPYLRVVSSQRMATRRRRRGQRGAPVFAAKDWNQTIYEEFHQQIWAKCGSYTYMVNIYIYIPYGKEWQGKSVSKENKTTVDFHGAPCRCHIIYGRKTIHKMRRRDSKMNTGNKIPLSFPILDCWTLICWVVESHLIINQQQVWTLHKCAAGPVFFLAIPAVHYICRKAANAPFSFERRGRCTSQLMGLIKFIPSINGWDGFYFHVFYTMMIHDEYDDIWYDIWYDIW